MTRSSSRVTPPPRPHLVIRVAIGRRNPLSGTASAGEGRTIRFDSWLALLDALSRLVCSEDDPTGLDPITRVAPAGPAPASDPDQ
jgi:hypothetical protein